MKESVPQNKAMKLTRLSAAPGRQAFDAVAEGAASCPRRRETAGTASQLIAGVLRTLVQRVRVDAGRPAGATERIMIA